MNDLEAGSRRDMEPGEPGRKLDIPASIHSMAINDGNRLSELEIENARLHRLVAELLIKNEKLRKPD